MREQIVEKPDGIAFKPDRVGDIPDGIGSKPGYDCHYPGSACAYAGRACLYPGSDCRYPGTPSRIGWAPGRGGVSVQSTRGNVACKSHVGARESWISGPESPERPDGQRASAQFGSDRCSRACQTKIVSRVLFDWSSMLWVADSPYPPVAARTAREIGDTPKEVVDRSTLMLLRPERKVLGSRPASE